jgi:cytosol aminopeptidase
MSAIYIVPVDPAAPPTAVGGQLDVSKLLATLPQSNKPAKAGTTHLWFDTPTGAQNITAITSLGAEWSKKVPTAKREIIRTAVGTAVQQVKALGDGIHGSTVHIDLNTPGVDAHAAAVAANLALYKFNLKTDPPSAFKPSNVNLQPPQLSFIPEPGSKEFLKDWEEGVIFAEAQNLARTLMELPANMLSPTLFAERIQREFKDIGNTRVIVRDAGKFSVKL